jgi:hypothetical protein
VVAEGTHGFHFLWVSLSLSYKVQIVLLDSVYNLYSIGCRYANKGPLENIKYCEESICIVRTLGLLDGSCQISISVSLPPKFIPSIPLRCLQYFLHESYLILLQEIISPWDINLMETRYRCL